MTARVGLTTAALLASLTLTGAAHVTGGHAATSASDLVVKTSGQYRSFGGFTSRTTNSLTRLVFHFGTPTSIRRDGGNCVIRWRNLRLVTYISVLGAVTGDPCSEGHVLAASMASRRWRTASGVRVGDPISHARSVCLARYGAKRCVPRAGRYPLQWQHTDCELGPGNFVVVFAKANAEGRVAVLRANNLTCE